MTTFAVASTVPDEALRMLIVRSADVVPMVERLQVHERVVPRFSQVPVEPVESVPLLSYANTSNSEVAIPDTQVPVV